MHGALVAVGTESSGSIGPWLVIVALAVAGIAQLHLWPNAKCRRCSGAQKFYSPLGDGHWRTCPRCGGSGKRMRTGRQIIGVFSKKDKERGRK